MIGKDIRVHSHETTAAHQQRGALERCKQPAELVCWDVDNLAQLALELFTLGNHGPDSGDDLEYFLSKGCVLLRKTWIVEKAVKHEGAKDLRRAFEHFWKNAFVRYASGTYADYEGIAISYRD